LGGPRGLAQTLFDWAAVGFAVRRDGLREEGVRLVKRFFGYLAYIVIVSAIVGVTYLTGFGSGWYLSAASGRPAVAATPVSADAAAIAALPSAFKPLAEALDIIQKEFYGRKDLDTQQLVRGAVKGMVDSLGDAHTYFLSPMDSRIAEEDLQGSFEGIGATIEKRDDKLLVVAPIEGSPAERAGLRPGDHIAAVDGKSTAPLTTMDAVALIRGPAGTVVRLTVLREGTTEPLTFEITRARIDTATVRTKELEGGVAYVRITSFSEPTSQELSLALKKLLANKPKALILDLRNNPGGYLTTSVEVASQFLKEGVVVFEENADGQRQSFNVRRGGLATDIPMVVLVNKGSASASEIVAGALQDANRAPLIGEKTFGKGSVQTTHALSDGSTIHVTIAHWFTPKGRQIHEVGLEPNITVPLTEEDAKLGKDPQLDRALEYIRTGK